MSEGHKIADLESSTSLVSQPLENILLKRVLLPFLLSSVEKLEKFVQENSTLFTLIGVFGAISIYAGRAPGTSSNYTEELQNFAVVAGFSIVLILSTIITINAGRRMASAESLISYENWGILSFLLFFIPLILVIIGLVSQFPTVWGIYAYVFSYAWATFVAMGLLLVPLILVTMFTKDDSQSQAIFYILVLVLYVGTTTAILGSSQPSSDLRLTGKGIGIQGMTGVFIIFFQIISATLSVVIISGILLMIALLAFNTMQKIVSGVKARL